MYQTRLPLLSLSAGLLGLQGPYIPLKYKSGEMVLKLHDYSRSAREMSLKRQLVQSNQLSYGYI
jgi:hypothetical protein